MLFLGGTAVGALRLEYFLRFGTLQSVTLGFDGSSSMSLALSSCRFGGSGFWIFSVISRGECGKKAVIRALSGGILLALVLR